MSESPFFSLAQERIREAIASGAFDNLPGAGRPLDLSDADDPDWWIKRRIREEGGDLSALAPALIQLRRERRDLLAGIGELASEDAVRDAVADFNERVRLERLRPSTPGLPPTLVTTLDVAEALERWREARGSGEAPGC
ncbi:DUF1992 domain-containing protein [Serinibacter salmoneus]|uniref:DnaJ family domain-containing protein n=1 Tax=Serinibacter salmoneus TaxID=556530 RepID=UPI001B80569F|nr:DUF1992 domain-containing protein [Serinibacter salmoneus]